MSVSLKQMLEGASAIPYNDELLAIIDESCMEYKDTNTTFQLIDELVVSFVTHCIPTTFKKHILNSMEDNGFEEVPTDEVFLRLAQYIVLDLIMNNEDSQDQAICASKLMSYMVVAKALKYPIPNTRFIVEAYSYHISNYLKNLDRIGVEFRTDIRSEIPDADFPLEISEEEANDIHIAFKESELYRIEQLLSSSQIQSIENPFVRVYQGLSKMFENLSYCFYNLNLLRIIELLTGNNKDEKKRKKFSNIKNDLEQSGCRYKYNCSATSILLRTTKGELLSDMDDLYLSIKEFAVYLYFELLIEKIISTQY